MCAFEYWHIIGSFVRSPDGRKGNDYYKFDREIFISKSDIANGLAESIYQEAITTSSLCAKWLFFNLWRLGSFASFKKIKEGDAMQLLAASAAADFAPAIVSYFNHTLMLKIFQNPKFIPTTGERDIIIKKLDVAMKSGNADASTMRANLIRWGKIDGSMEDAFYLLQSSIARGDPDACYIYADLHYQLAKNPIKACFYLELAKNLRVDYENLFHRAAFDSKINVLSSEIDTILQGAGKNIKVFAMLVATRHFDLPLPEFIDDSDPFFQRSLYHHSEPRVSVAQIDAEIENRFQ